MGASVRFRDDRDAWFVYFARAGRRWNKRIGAGDEGKARADAIAAAFNAEAAEIKEVRDSLYPGGAAPFSSVAAAWWDAKSAAMPASTIDSKRCVVYTRLIPFFKAQDVRRIDDDRVRACAVKQAENGHARETVETTGSVLDGILSWSVAKGYADRCPALRAGGGQGVRAIFRAVAAARCKPSARIEAWTMDEVAQIIQCARERGDWLADPVLFASQTGCRRGEILALEWADVDLERGRALIRQSFSRGQLKATKADKVRSIELAPDAVDMLRRRAEKGREGRVFRGKRGRIWTDRGFNTAWQRARAEAVKLGVKRLKFHCFRHSWASWALAAGHDAVWAAAQIGDTLQVFLRRYVHELAGPRRSLDFLKISPLAAAPQPESAGPPAKAAAPAASASRAKRSVQKPSAPAH